MNYFLTDKPEYVKPCLAENATEGSIPTLLTDECFDITLQKIAEEGNNVLLKCKKSLKMYVTHFVKEDGGKGSNLKVVEKDGCEVRIVSMLDSGQTEKAINDSK